MFRLNFTRWMVPLCVVFMAIAAHASTITLPTADALGLSPGDQYQFVFVTSGTTNANGTTLATYNTFVQNAADSGGIGSAVGMTWKAIANVGSSPNRAIDNAVVLATTKVFRVDGTQIADGSTHPFYSTTDHLAPIDISELGTTITRNVWTGGNPTGSESGSGLLGSTTPVFGHSDGSSATNGTTGWARDSNIAKSNLYSIYAVSNALTAPEPGSLALFATASVLLLLRRKSADI